MGRNSLDCMPIFHEQMIRCHEKEIELFRLADDTCSTFEICYEPACGSVYTTVTTMLLGKKNFVGKSRAEKEIALDDAIKFIKDNYL